MPDDLAQMHSVLDALADDFTLSVGEYLRGRAHVLAARLELSSADDAERRRIVNAHVDAACEVLAELVSELRATLPSADDRRADLHDRQHDERHDNARIEGDEYGGERD